MLLDARAWRDRHDARRKDMLDVVACSMETLELAVEARRMQHMRVCTLPTNQQTTSDRRGYAPSQLLNPNPS